MNQPASNLPPFPQSLIDARHKADAAWDLEREAWAPISGKNVVPHDEVMPWYKLRATALDAQAVFEEEIEQWRRAAKLP